MIQRKKEDGCNIYIGIAVAAIGYMLLVVASLNSMKERKCGRVSLQELLFWIGLTFLSGGVIVVCVSISYIMVTDQTVDITELLKEL